MDLGKQQLRIHGLSGEGTWTAPNGGRLRYVPLTTLMQQRQFERSLIENNTPAEDVADRLLFQYGRQSEWKSEAARRAGRRGWSVVRVAG